MDDEQSSLIKAMKKAGYHYDSVESYEKNVRFWHEYGTLQFDSWGNLSQWLDGVVFDDPEIMIEIEMILHPERFLDDKKDELEELRVLCNKNGRDYTFTKNGKLVTFDKYDGCDGRICENVQDAIDWEKGYLYSASEVASKKSKIDFSLQTKSNPFLSDSELNPEMNMTQEKYSVHQ